MTRCSACHFVAYHTAIAAGKAVAWSHGQHRCRKRLTAISVLPRILVSRCVSRQLRGGMQRCAERFTLGVRDATAGKERCTKWRFSPIWTVLLVLALWPYAATAAPSSSPASTFVSTPPPLTAAQRAALPARVPFVVSSSLTLLTGDTISLQVLTSHVSQLLAKPCRLSTQALRDFRYLKYTCCVDEPGHPNLGVVMSMDHTLEDNAKYTVVVEVRVLLASICTLKSARRILTGRRHGSLWSQRPLRRVLLRRPRLLRHPLAALLWLRSQRAAAAVATCRRPAFV